MEKANLAACLNDPQYRPLRSDTLDRLKLKPHHALYHNTHKRLLVLLKQSSGGDFSTNTDMVKSLCNLQSTEQIAQAYLVQVVDGVPIAWETAPNVAKKINGINPRDGDYGPYVWLQAHTFNVAGTAWLDEELPF